MYLALDDFQPAWKRLLDQSRSHSTCKVAIFVSGLDVDALCAARMLGHLFRRDLILHKIIPILGLSSLSNAFKGLDEEVRNVILIGCGAYFDLEEILGEEYLSNRKVHIMDNHRPWNLENLYGNDNILCYDDGGLEDADAYREAWQYLADHPEKPSEEGEQVQEEDDYDDEIMGYKRRRADDDERHKYAEMLVEYMQQGTYLYSTVTVQVYTLFTMIGATSKQNLWLMTIGVCSLESRAPEIYASMYPIVKDEITRLGDNKTNYSSSEVSLFTELDFSLFLLREWSLYESMMHSSYVSSKFKLWTETGRKKLNKMLAQMGISLSEAKENWIHMSQPLKKELKEKLQEVAGIYEIENVLRDGVIRKFGYMGIVSANDCAQAAGALLEGTGTKSWNENFWDAWSSLEDYSKIKEGVARAKLLQKLIISTSTAVFDKGQPKNLRSYRLVVLQDGPDLEVLGNPLTLLRLGTWIADGCSEMESYSYQPLVIACFNEATDRYLVLGMAPRKRRDDIIGDLEPSKNLFSVAFQQVSHEISANTTIDAFDSEIIEVRKDDLSRFLEKLATDLSI